VDEEQRRGGTGADRLWEALMVRCRKIFHEVAGFVHWTALPVVLVLYVSPCMILASNGDLAAREIHKVSYIHLD
jgi:hypothetical protein